MKLPSPPAESHLLPWLLTALKPMSRSKVKLWLREGLVAVNGVAVTRHDFPIGSQDRIEIVRGQREPDSRSKLTVLFRDESLVAIDKPAGLLSVATDSEKLDTAFVRIKTELECRPFVVHRLDRETSGVLLFARSDRARDALQAGWNEVEKTYLAVVEGVPRESEGIIENYLTEMKNLRVRATKGEIPGSKLASTRYRLLQKVGRYSLLEVRIRTGRKHQIRVHLSGMGCPVVGDNAYGSRDDFLKRLGLHAWRLAFEHPEKREHVEIEAAIPGEWCRILKIDRDLL